MSYAEIHFHLLPGLDDGPETIEESVELARAAAAEGTSTIVATPHVNSRWVTDVSVIADAVSEVRAALVRGGVPVDVRAGGELALAMAGRLGQDELDAIAQGPAARRWLLLEPPFAGMDESYTAAADELRERGFGVVVAHPERTAPGPATTAAIERELAAGSILQFTARSFIGEHGEHARTIAWRWLRAAAGRAVIGSDAHALKRPPALRRALAALSAGGVRDPERLAYTLPRALIERGLAVPPAALAA